jgi:MoaA/NifB/PqqE/SkfB family radical SAM enzyme
MIFPETIQSLFGTKPRVKIIHPTLTTFDQLKNHFQKKAPKDWWYKPISLELEINTVCNLRCTGCVIIDDIENPTHEFSTKQLLDILKQSAELGVYNYSLTGGEPFLVTDQICDIIAQAPIDIFKIQTNATRFNTEKSALKILNQLKKAGFVSRNKYVKPSINVSLGMQTLEGAPIECVAILTKTFLETFGKTAQLGLNLVPYVKGIDDENTLDKLEAAYESLYGEKFPYQKIRLNQFELQYTPRLEEEKIISTKKTTIKKLIKSRNNNTACFNFTKKIDTPVPRFMIRADGKFYPCACFGHAFLAGNINNDSLYNLLTRVNTNEQLRVVFDKGLYGLLKLTEKTNPQLANMEIPETLHPCRACRLLRFPEDLPDIIKIGG